MDLRVEVLWACFRSRICQNCPMKDGVTSHRGRKLPIPVGQGDEVVEQMASSGREETAEAIPSGQNPVILPVPTALWRG